VSAHSPLNAVLVRVTGMANEEMPPPLLLQSLMKVLSVATRSSPTAPSPDAPGQHHTIELKLNGKTSTVSTDDPDALLDLLRQAGTRTA
jgi:hypothetical protein